MNWLIIFLRSAITLTFLILATCGPWALYQLSRFIKRYTTAHEALKERVAVLERRLGMSSDDKGTPA